MLSSGCVIAAADQLDTRDAMNLLLTYLPSSPRPITRPSLLVIPADPSIIRVCILFLCSWHSKRRRRGVRHSHRRLYGNFRGWEGGDVETRRWEMKQHACEATGVPHHPSAPTTSAKYCARGQARSPRLPPSFPPHCAHAPYAHPPPSTAIFEHSPRHTPNRAI